MPRASVVVILVAADRGYRLRAGLGSDAGLTRAGAGLARPQRVKVATVPRSLTPKPMAPADNGTIGRGSLVNDKVDKASDGVTGQTLCLVKSA